MESNNKISNVIRTTFISAFTVLMALAIRDTFTTSIESALPNRVQETLIFNYIYTLCVILITILLIYFWK